MKNKMCINCFINFACEQKMSAMCAHFSGKKNATSCKKCNNHINCLNQSKLTCTYYHEK